MSYDRSNKWNILASRGVDRGNRRIENTPLLLTYVKGVVDYWIHKIVSFFDGKLL